MAARERRQPRRISFNLPNKIWEDQNTEGADPEGQVGATLDPGESVTLSSIESTNDPIKIRPRAIGTTQHADDVFNDGTRQSIVKYVYERKYHPNDTWGEIPGFSSTLRYGSLNDPTEIVPGTFLEEMQAFRIRVVNRTDTTTNQYSINVNKLGALVNGAIVYENREGGEL